MVQTIPLGYLSKKKYPLVRKEFPDARWMAMDGTKYKTLTQAKESITRQMVRRGYAKPKFEIVR